MITATSGVPNTKDTDAEGKPLRPLPEAVRCTMAIIGQVEPFDDSVSDWDSYEERLTAFIRANQIPEANWVDAFLSVIGPKSYKLLKSLNPHNPPRVRL